MASGTPSPSESGAEVVEALPLEVVVAVPDVVVVADPAEHAVVPVIVEQRNSHL